MTTMRKLLKRMFCAHFYWHEVSSLEMGSFSRGLIECNCCGKRKLIDDLKPFEVLN